MSGFLRRMKRSARKNDYINNRNFANHVKNIADEKDSNYWDVLKTMSKTSAVVRTHSKSVIKRQIKDLSYEIKRLERSKQSEGTT